MTDRDTLSDVHGYHLIEEIGHGAFGKVFKAEHILTNKIFCIKSVPVGNEYAYVSAFLFFICSLDVILK